MKTKNGFTEFETIKEFETWINKQNISRKIKYLQVHHMSLPSYTTWKNTDCKLWGESGAPLGRTQSLEDYGKKTWNSKSANGKYIAQHFNIFPNGHITTGRSLESTPIGIKGWNTNAICVEIYGDFDKGKDTMNTSQKKAVIALYALLCNKFKITPSASTIRPHAWFTSGGTYLGGYNSSKSTKSCPGTNFMGIGNSKTVFEGKFYPWIKQYMKDGSYGFETPTSKTYIVRVICDSLNGRKGAGTTYDVECKLTKGIAVTIVEEKKVGTATWGKTKSGYWINLGSKYVQKV